MVAAYRDRAGTVHLFTDAYDPRRETAFDDPLDSWEAEPRYLTTTDFDSWQDHGFALTRGRWRGGVARSDGDCVGVASPGVAVAGGKVLLFYAGKGPANPAGPFARTTNREDLPGLIHLAVAPADENGAPAGPFEKRGPVTDYDAGWRSIRHDDPNAVVTGEEVLLFFKGIGPGQTHANRVFGVARTPVGRPEGPYRIHPEPILRTDRGVESPRVFRDRRPVADVRAAVQPSRGRQAAPLRALPRGGPAALGAGERRGAGDDERPPPARGRGHVPAVDAVRAGAPEARLQQPPGRRGLGGPRGVQAVAVGD